MTVDPAVLNEEPSAATSLEEFRRAVAEDLRQLAVLHDREPDRELLRALRESGFPGGLALRLGSEAGESACQRMAEGIALLPDPPDDETLEWLAVDFADIYLNYSLRASPFESVWLDEDGLLHQQPMFNVRRWYERYGVAAREWRLRSDDHLTLQLEFLALVLDPAADEEEDTPAARLSDAARFMDEHLLRWLPDFAACVSRRCGTIYFAGIALLTAAYAEELRDHLAELLGEPRPSREEIEERMKPQRVKGPEIMCDNTPAVAPSW